MDSSQISSTAASGVSSPRSRSNTKLVDDITSLTSFNPFSEEDENEQSSYALVTSLFSRVKNSLAGPLASVASTAVTTPPAREPAPTATEPSRPSTLSGANPPRPTRTASDRPPPLHVIQTRTAPPLLSYTPVVSEAPSFNLEPDRPPSRGGGLFPFSYDSQDGGLVGTAIPGFPIQDDARSIRTSLSNRRQVSVSKAVRKMRGEGLSKDYWMDDENAKECYDCKSVFTTWRRKHHCRICGQIFCSRCASNIIAGARFGHDGMIRVCNLCLEEVSKDEEDDQDDTRSIMSGLSSPFPAHQLGHIPQSPFSASQIFGRTDEPFNLFSIAEGRRVSSSEGNSRPMSPRDPEEDDRMWEVARAGAVPFRRAASTDDDKDGISPPSRHDGRGGTPPPMRSKTPIEFPTSLSLTEGLSSIQFPSSPDGPVDSPRPNSGLRSRFDSFGPDFEVATPFIRSRVQSRLGYDPPIMAEAGWRTRRESTAYAQELNLISMFHLRIMLQQMLKTEGIPNVTQWEEVLLRLALRIAREMTFTALPQRQGADMDVRRYVKIKKIPGGAPADSEYVDGAVITKNVAHKQMSRDLRNPRVMIVTFPLEFHRVEGQYMHFGQIVRQEKEYLGNLAARIAALRPHVILVEKSVSRLALDSLARHKIAVARSVKPSAIQLVSRMTQGDVFSSMDKLALEPRLGHCARFRIQTFDHALIPGRRKTYMRFEGCNRDMGCTILLRGGDIDTLRRVKKVTRFLTFIVRNLKLETHLWKDSVITLPNLTTDATPAAPGSVSATNFAAVANAQQTVQTKGLISHDRRASNSSVDEDLPNEDAEQLRLSRRIQDSLDPYIKTFISVSATVRFPPPYPIRRMKELDQELICGKHAWEDEVISREERAHIHHDRDATITATSNTPRQLDQDDLSALIASLPSPDIPATARSEMMRKGTEGDYFGIMPIASSNSVPSSPFPQREMPPEAAPALKTVGDIALESQLSHVKEQHEEQRRIWEWYLRKNKDDFVVEKYQCISLWEMVYPLSEFGHRRPCFPPQMKYITFYGENDCTLGRFIEQSVHDTLVQFLDPKATCLGKGCGQPIARHCTVYVHNETRLLVAVEQWDGQINGRACYPQMPELITTWSSCRVCGSATPFIPVSEEMQRYSLAKFLELHFYPADVELVQGAGCNHNIYVDHIRYFACRGMTVRFQADPIVLYEVAYPPMHIRVRPETLLELKNEDYQRLLERNIAWYAALIEDLRNIKDDAATGDEEHDAELHEQVAVLTERAHAEREEVARLVHTIYRESAPTDTLALNQVRAYRQDKIVAWQQDFDRLPKPKLAVVAADRNSRRVSAFGTVSGFGSMWQRYGLLEPHLPSSSVSEAEEGPLPRRRVTGDSILSTTSSDASASESEDHSDMNQGGREKGGSSPSLLAPSTIMPESSETDAESDSTIGAKRGLSANNPSSPVQAVDQTKDQLGPLQRISRLPRRPAQHVSVADLVKRYQEVLPADGVRDLAKTALSPQYPVSESDQEYTTRPTPRPAPRRPRPTNKPPVARKTSSSDFESSYAMNVAPRYLANKKPAAQQAASSRIPGPVPIESPVPHSPSDKRPSLSRNDTDDTIKKCRTLSPPAGRAPVIGPVPTSAIKGKGNRALTLRDKVPSRPPSAAGKSSFRKPMGQGSKVSHIAKHFEKITKDNERQNRRYAVIRGRRARPVASFRGAKVEVLDSVKDAIRDESESSDSSSEADDEGEGEEESGKVVNLTESPLASSSISENPPSVSISEPDAAKENGSKEQPQTRSTDMVVPGLPRPVDFTSSVPPSPLLAAVNRVYHMHTPPASDLDVSTAVLDSRKSSILDVAFSRFWGGPLSQHRHRMEIDGDDPLADPEHIFREASMVVRTDEPTSIIALVLNSPQYREMLIKSRVEKRNAREPKLTDGGGEAFMPDDRSVADSNSTWGVVNVDSSDSVDPTEDMRTASSKLPWAFTFESSGLIISCTVLFPEQFDALRRTYDCEKRMIESLARCIKWDANGGKSGSAFLKTRDDRFIAKELSKAELQSLATFAPAYFEYMSSAVTAQRPTLLAKIFGCYKITFKKTQDHGPRAKHTQMNLLVMENLFYDRRFSKIYDLKGSTRNRHVQSTGRENEVLLDENLVEIAHITPFYLREHSKRIIRGALYNDSKFLADVNVMDYSLVVGVDGTNNELVIGIVDYIRSYTWDKKLESWVKDTAFLGGGAGKGEPTIITPKQYRQRFIVAMERYFPLVPDRWMKQKDAPEEDPNTISELWPDW